MACDDSGIAGCPDATDGESPPVASGQTTIPPASASLEIR